MSCSPSSGTLAEGRHRLAARVYYEDTDASGIAYHASYLRWFERGRTEMLRHTGVALRDEAEAGTGYFAVHDMQIIWHRPARLDDALEIHTLVDRVRAAAVVMGQSVVHRGETLCTATVTAALLSMDGRPRRLPRDWTAAFEDLAHLAKSD
ncbi:YbgC/FadM family acyl-CoA thioesterase [Polymorphobacter sp.]|uniref:YbgC/FadM family acyl-CoA thioesterase n=1 Tax=Polymorphobacter sp. TaxID=1909290 RepID=UPI003F71AB3A